MGKYMQAVLVYGILQITKYELILVTYSTRRNRPKEQRIVFVNPSWKLHRPICNETELTT